MSHTQGLFILIPELLHLYGAVACRYSQTQTTHLPDAGTALTRQSCARVFPLLVGAGQLPERSRNLDVSHIPLNELVIKVDKMFGSPNRRGGAEKRNMKIAEARPVRPSQCMLSGGWSVRVQ